MAKITKEQWQKLEEDMTCGYVDIKFKYQGYEISIQRVRTSENKSGLAVYIDGVISPKWGLIDRVVEGRPPIIGQVWKKKTMAKYNAKTIKDIEKVFGKRQAKKEYPNLHERHEWFESVFPKASVLCRQFKRLEDLELITEGS
ncbi:hypothetical protein [Vibrio nigripulchritudo]|uniref:hypothetical protein n=1 Tax=Vibrio nigripulchritudo TaxID=28173 RepID=UPI0003B229E3|nr:hypothetical protein [Vibrio nigripulchritudo]CCN69760.1 conserved hypothetical protein [Vibrio nigripulchritudo SFn118]